MTATEKFKALIRGVIREELYPIVEQLNELKANGGNVLGEAGLPAKVVEEAPKRQKTSQPLKAGSTLSMLRQIVDPDTMKGIQEKAEVHSIDDIAKAAQDAGLGGAASAMFKDYGALIDKMETK